MERIANQIEVAVREASAGSNAGLTPEEIEEKRIRERVIKRREERTGVIIHTAVYVFVNLLMWAIWASDAPQIFQTISGTALPSEVQQVIDFPWPLIVMFFWGIGLFSHISDYYNKYGGGAEKREREIQREIQRERERSMAYEKPKNDRRSRLELTDDGEITEVYDDELSQANKRKRR